MSTSTLPSVHSRTPSRHIKECRGISTVLPSKNLYMQAKHCGCNYALLITYRTLLMKTEGDLRRCCTSWPVNPENCEKWNVTNDFVLHKQTKRAHTKRHQFVAHNKRSRVARWRCCGNVCQPWRDFDTTKQSEASKRGSQNTLRTLQQ